MTICCVSVKKKEGSIGGSKFEMRILYHGGCSRTTDDEVSYNSKSAKGGKKSKERLNYVLLFFFRMIFYSLAAAAGLSVPTSNRFSWAVGCLRLLSSVSLAGTGKSHRWIILRIISFFFFFCVFDVLIRILFHSITILYQLAGTFPGKKIKIYIALVLIVLGTARTPLPLPC
jgi:hypothetical protein